MVELLLDLFKIVIADIVLSGDNALVIGMAAASLPAEQRRKAIIFGMVIATVLRIIFAIIATSLLEVPAILFVGALLLLWVCWRLYCDIRSGHETDSANAEQVAAGSGFAGALLSITIADVSMSLDNVLAVASIADGNIHMLVFGLGLAILLMAFAATLIMKLLTRFRWISWLGLFVLLYVALEMLYRGIFDPSLGVLPIIETLSA